MRTSGRLRPAGAVASLLCAAALSVLGLALPGGIGVSHASATLDDWATSLHDVERTAASSDTTLSTAVAPTLTRIWSFQAGGTVATSPTVVAGIAYFGSWDGYEYAVNASTGTLVWKQFLGQMDIPSNCYPSGMIGVSSPATVLNGVVYVGGGDGYFYALDAATGAIDWQVWVSGPGTPGIYDGHYDWSGPLVVNGFAYVGVASFGDCPLVQGQLLQVSLTTHGIVNTLNLVPNSQVGGGLWTSPAYDPSSNTIYFTTGTQGGSTSQQPWSQAILAVNATTLDVESHWKLPANVLVNDADFGTSAILFSDASGDPLVEAINKNGVAYAFKRSNLAAGPVWHDQVAVGGESPTSGDASVSSGAFGGGRLYLAGGNGVINGVGHPGTVRAIDPSTGAYLWQHAAPGIVIGALAYDNGMVFDGGGSVLEVLDAATGQRLYSYDTGSQIYAGPSTSQGIIFVGNTAGQVDAFAEPPSPPPTPPPDASCPSGFTCQDIGAPSPAGSETVSAGTWSVSAGGAGIAGGGDSFRLLSEPTDGDAQLTAQLTGTPALSTGQAGLMIRQGDDPGSPFYAAIVLGAAGSSVEVVDRSQFGGAVSVLTTASISALPIYLMLRRVGDAFEAATSTDGVTWSLIAGSETSLPLPAVSLAGLAVSSGTDGSAGSATFSSVTLGAPGTAPNPQGGAGCPSGWSCQDVGDPSPVGGQSLTSGTWSVSGAGAGIVGQSDQFHLAWQPLAADGAVSADVASQQNTNAYAQAGVLLRGGTDPGAPYYGAFVTPGEGVMVSYRGVDGLPMNQLASLPGTAPVCLEVARSGDTFTAYTAAGSGGTCPPVSPTSTAWAPVTGSTITLPGLSGQLLAGLAVESHAAGTLGAATFEDVAITTSAQPSPDVCASGWTCADIGFPLPSGQQAYNATGGQNGSAQWTVLGGGSDIFGTADAFRFVSESVAGNGMISARVASQGNSDPWAKAGVMVRLSNGAGSPYYGVFVTPSNGIAVQYRTVQGATTNQTVVAGSAPAYVEVQWTGTTFTAYTSNDGGATWTAVPGSAVSIPALTGVFQAGLAVCSHNTTTLDAAVFDTVSVQGVTAPGGLPGLWSDMDVGGATPAGSATYANYSFSVQGGGTGIAPGSDQFNYVSQPLAGDASLIARVTSVTGTASQAAAGVMIKQSTTSGSDYALVAVTPGNGVIFQDAAGSVSSGGAYGFPNAWLRLDKIGNLFIAYASGDGTNWVELGHAQLPIADPSTAGFFVTSGSATSLSTATFDDVSLMPTGGGPLPPPWTFTDVGTPALAGSSTYADGAFTVNGAGSGIWGSADQFQYAYQSMTGDGSITARVTFQTQTDPWAMAGVMIKQSASAGAPYVLAAVTPGNGMTMQYGFDTKVSGSGYSFPNAWLSLTRVGNTFIARQSANGSTWTAIGSVSLTMNDPVTVGLFVTSLNAGELSTATFDSVAVTSAMPSPWISADVGGPTPAGTASYSGGTYTVEGGGADIWGSADQFHYVYQPWSGPLSLTARVTSQTNTDSWAKAGVMIKQSTTAGSPYALLAVTPGNGAQLQYGFSSTVSAGSYAFPDAWLRLTLFEGTVSAYVSSDGTTWSEVGSTTLDLTDPYTVGLFVCSHNTGELGTATFDDVSVTSMPPPSPWLSGDVGTPVLAGASAYTSGTFMLSGAGTGIWGTAVQPGGALIPGPWGPALQPGAATTGSSPPASTPAGPTLAPAWSDQFQYVHQAVSGDFTITARVTSQTDTSPWAMAGLMVKQSTAPGSPYALLAVTPAEGLELQDGFNSSVDVSGGGYAFPHVWLRLTRVGGSVTAYQSSDGVTWVEVGSVSVTLTDPVTAGLFVTSDRAAEASIATFDEVSVTSP